MIDIIITTHKFQNKLLDTLNSIINQKKIPNLNIYIIDNLTNYDYSNILSKFNEKLNITLKKIDKNMKPGYSRNVALSISKSKYIVFIDSNDVLNDKYSLSNLYNKISKEDCDVVTSKVYKKTNNEIYENELIGLQGKIYNRQFIEKHNIKFNNTKCNEDYAFNSLIKLHDAKISNINTVTYVLNNNSFTRKNKEKYYNDDAFFFAKNSFDTIKNSIKNECNIIKIIMYCVESIIGIYYRFKLITNNNIKTDVTAISNKIFKIYKFLNPNVTIYDYIKSHNLISDNEKKEFNQYLKRTICLTEKLTNYQRKERGMIFNPTDSSVNCDRAKHIELMYEFNHQMLYDHENITIKTLEQQMFGYFDCSSVIEPPVYSSCGCQNVFIGKKCFLNFNITFIDDGKILIGNNVIIAPNVQIITVNHPICHKIGRHNQIYAKGITIKDNVWIGAGAIILPGVTIGENSVIGAGSVVIENIPPNVVAAGNPCKVIRKINLYDEIFYDDNLFIK